MRPSSPTGRLALYLVAVLGLGAVLELACRRWQPLFRAASHRSLFKAALLEQRPPQDLVVFGTSRAGEALRPRSLVSELAALGAQPLSSFNVSTPFSSLEILHHVATRFAGSKGLKVALVEVSRNQLSRNPLPWASAPPKEGDADGQVFAWLEKNLSLAAERKVFVFNSLARLGVVSLFAPRFDGTEEFGSDYVQAIAGMDRDVPPSSFEAVTCAPRAVEVAPGALLPSEDRALYADLAKAFRSRGVQLAFFVPPAREGAEPEERAPPFRALLSQLRAVTGAPVLDYSECALPPSYFRDPNHLSRVGGSHFSRMVARALMQEPSLAAAVGAHAVP